MVPFRVGTLGPLGLHDAGHYHENLQTLARPEGLLQLLP